MSAMAVLGFALLSLGAAAVAIEGDLDSNLMQSAAKGHTQLDPLGPANSSRAFRAEHQRALAEHGAALDAAKANLTTSSLIAARLCFTNPTANPIRLAEIEILAPDGTNAVAGVSAVGTVSAPAITAAYRYFDGDLNWQSPWVSWTYRTNYDCIWVDFSTFIPSVSSVNVIQIGHPSYKNTHWDIWVARSDWSEGFSGTCNHCDETFVGTVEFSGYLSVQQTVSAPTPPPTPVPVSATGDPHLQNVNGERFDLMKPGNHVLVNIPRGERAEKALLRVEAEASKLGGLCEEIYFTDLNITGSWAYAEQAGGYHFVSQGPVPETHKWTTLGAVEFKVVRARTATGTQYLNFYVKHLGRAGFAVGGLLGEDDHMVESMPSAACVRHVQLKKLPLPLYSSSSAVSTAQATLA